MNIVVIGAGYVGLANAVLLAQYNQVVLVDILQEKIDMINEKRSPILDEEIELFLQTKKLNLLATTNYEQAFSEKQIDYVIIATPTDYDSKQNFFDTSSIENAIDLVLKYVPGTTIIIKSTIPVGYVENIRKRMHTESIIYSPEFLREGKALYDNLYPSRIIIGEKSRIAENFVSLLKEGAVKKEIPTLYTNPTEAEAIKLFSNTYLALRVSFFNELDSYAEAKGLNTKQIIDGVCLDSRIGNYYNNPSFGYGGYCLPKDTKQLLANFKDVPQNIMSAIVEANRTRKDFIAESILKRSPNTVGIYRLTMKTSSDNFRHSAVWGIMRRIRERGIEVVVYEPSIEENDFLDYKLIKDLEEFKQKSDVIVANRITPELYDIMEKVYTRDIYSRD